MRKQYKSIIHVAALFGLLTLAVALMCIDFMQNGNIIAKIAGILISKGLAIGALFLLGHLYERWSKEDPWLTTVERISEEAFNNNE